MDHAYLLQTMNIVASSKICMVVCFFRLARCTVFTVGVFRPLTILIYGIFHYFKLCFWEAISRFFFTLISSTLEYSGSPRCFPLLSAFFCCCFVHLAGSTSPILLQSRSCRLLQCQAVLTAAPKGTKVTKSPNQWYN